MQTVADTSDILTLLVAVPSSILPITRNICYAILDCKRSWACIFAVTNRVDRARL
jgi:hypothetical protein